jgi:predicted nucleic acid-binding Zn ribbon protein
VKRGIQPQQIGDVLSDVLEDAGVLRQFERLGVLDMWPEIVGERVAAVTHARSVDDTALVVEVRSSAWLMELNMMKGDLLERVNEHATETPMDRLVFVLAETE